MRHFNNEQRSFLDSMSNGFSNNTSDDQLIYLAWFFIVGFVLLVAVIFYLTKNWYFLRGRVIYFYRLIRGKGPVHDRVTRTLDITIQIPNPKYSVPTSSEITIKTPTPSHFMIQTKTYNLSPNGVFVKISPPLKKGEKFKFVLFLTAEDTFSGFGEVVWIQNKWTEHHPTGVGCRFLHLDEADRNRLRLFLKKNPLRRNKATAA